MNTKFFGAIVGFGIFSASVGAAATADIGFSFDDGQLPVFGTLFGLEENGTSLAQSVEVFVGTGSTATRFVFEDLSATRNQFTVTGGTVTFASFSAETLGPNVLDFELDASAPLDDNWLFFSPVFNVSGTDLTFGSVPTTAAVPLPAGGVLLLTALAGMARLQSRKKHQA